MAKDKLEDWDEVAANNLDMGGISLAENVMRPPAVNNEMREHMAQVSKWLGDDTLVAATTTDLGTVPGRYISVTGNTTITGFGTIKSGTIKYLKFTGTPTITYNATSMILPGAVSIVATAGDTALFVSEGSGNWRCVAYQRAAGGLSLQTIVLKQSTTPTPTAEGDIQWDTDDDRIVVGNGTNQTQFIRAPVQATDISLTSSSSFLSLPAGIKKMTLDFSGLSTNGTVVPVIQLGTAAGLQTSSYTGKAISMSSTPSIVISTNSTGFLLAGGSWAAAVTVTGTIDFTRLGPGGNTWIARGQIVRTDVDQVQFVSGAITLVGALDRIAIVTSDAFDNGNAGLFYEFGL